MHVQPGMTIYLPVDVLEDRDPANLVLKCCGRYFTADRREVEAVAVIGGIPSGKKSSPEQGASPPLPPPPNPEGSLGSGLTEEERTEGK